MVSLLPLTAAAADPGALHRAFAGWDAGGAVFWRASGSRSRAGSSERFTQTQRGLIFRQSASNAYGLGTAQGFNGRTVWNSDPSGFVNFEYGRAAQAALALDLVRSESVQQEHPSVAGHATVNGSACTVVRIQPTGLPPIDIYEDDANGAYVRVVVAPGSSDERSFDDLRYTKVDGKEILSSWRSGDMLYRLTSFDLTKPVADADLTPPPAQASWTIDSSPVPFWLSTQSDNSRAVRVVASVNGRSGVFLLSTGTPAIVLFSDFARDAGVKDEGTLAVSPFSGNVNFEGYALARNVQIGKSTLHNVAVAKLTSPGNRMAGILGYDFFAGAVVNVDLVRSVLTMSPASQAPVVPSQSYAFPVDLTTLEPAIAMPLVQGEMHPVIDTGLSGFILASQALRDSGRLSGHDISSQAAVGFGGQGATGDPIATMGLNISYTDWHSSSTSGSCVSTDQLFVGPYKYENPPVCFAGANVLGPDGGRIGLDFLRHFNWTVDYPHGRFIVSPIE